MTRPLIGITAGYPTVDLSAEDERSTPQAVLRRDYLRGIEAAGGLGVIISADAGEAAAEIVARLDGVLLTGGADVDPSLYGEALLNGTVKPQPARDRLELAVVRAADAADVPLFAICRGIQILNVARGGTLYQDLPSQHPSPVAHRQDGDGTVPAHPVVIDAGSRLYAISGTQRLAANSLHHQGVKELGRGLRPTAHAPDGLVEAVEDPDRSFLVAVQWHPERLLSEPPHGALFAAFIAATQRPGSSPPFDRRPAPA